MFTVKRLPGCINKQVEQDEKKDKIEKKIVCRYMYLYVPQLIHDHSLPISTRFSYI